MFLLPSKIHATWLCQIKTINFLSEIEAQSMNNDICDLFWQLLSTTSCVNGNEKVKYISKCIQKQLQHRTSFFESIHLLSTKIMLSNFLGPESLFKPQNSCDWVKGTWKYMNILPFSNSFSVLVITMKTISYCAFSFF